MNVRVRVLGLDELVRHGGVSVVLVACDQPALPGVDSDDLLILEGEGVPGELLKGKKDKKRRSYIAILFFPHKIESCHLFENVIFMFRVLLAVTLSDLNIANI